MASKTQILNVLPKTRLLEIAREYDVSGLSARRKADIAKALARKRSIPMTEVFDFLKRDELKAICRELGLDDRGKEKALISERIINALGPRTRKWDYPDKFTAGGLTFEYHQETAAWYAEYEDEEFGIYLMNGPDTENDWASPDPNSDKPEWGGLLYSLEDIVEVPNLMQSVVQDVRQLPFFAKAQPVENIESGSGDIGNSAKDPETSALKDAVEEVKYVEMATELVIRKVRTPAIQVFIDRLPNTEPQEWQPTVEKFAQRWIESKSIDKEATIWFWGSSAMYYGDGLTESLWAEFAVPFGFGTGFFDFLLIKLKELWGSAAVKISSYVVVDTSEGWSVLCHVKDGKVWQPVDPITWIEVKS